MISETSCHINISFLWNLIKTNHACTSKIFAWSRDFAVHGYQHLDYFLLYEILGMLKI